MCFDSILIQACHAVHTGLLNVRAILFLSNMLLVLHFVHLTLDLLCIIFLDHTHLVSV